MIFLLFLIKNIAYQIKILFEQFAYAIIFVTYSNAAKHAQVGVPEVLIAERGAVSAPVARAMARGGLDQCPADVAL